VEWSGLLWLFLWPTEHTAWLPAVSTGVTHPPYPLPTTLHAALVILQGMFKKSANPTSNYIAQKFSGKTYRQI